MKKVSILICVFMLVLESCKLEVTCTNDHANCTDLSFDTDTTKSDRKILIIGIDGFRADVLQADIAPFMYELSKKHTSFFNPSHATEDYSISGPNWTSLITGVHWCKHNVTNNDFDDERIHEFPGLFYYIEQAIDDVQTASLSTWTPINSEINARHADFAPTNSTSDVEVFHAAKEILLNHNPIDADAFFIQFDELDGAGHNGGYGAEFPLYTSTLNRIDSYVFNLFSIIHQKRNAGENWMTFIISDHGGDKNGHGNGQGNSLIDKTIFIANHPTISFNQGYASAQVDLAPTVLDFLGISSSEFNCKTDGVSLIN